MRRLVIILVGCLLGACVALAVLPWWLAPVLRMVGRHYGAEFTRYERLGYARFAVHDVTVEQPTVRVQAKRAESDTPVVWLFRHLRGTSKPIVATTWRVDVKPRAVAAPQPARSASGALRTRAILFKVANALDRWVSPAEVGAGVVSWPGAELRIDAARWAERTLTVRPLRYKTQAAEINATFTANNEIHFEARPAGEAAWRVSLKNVRDDITGQFHAWDQTGRIDLRLPPAGWMPATLQINATRWTIPASALKLGGAYATVRGDGQIEWREKKLEVSVDAAGEPLREKKAPPLVARLHARGDASALTIDSLLLEIPGARANLDVPVTFNRKGGMPAGASRFTLELDLEKQPWLAGAKGKASGRADVVSTGDGFPHIEGTVEAQNLAIGDWSVARFASAAALDWPRLWVKETVIGFAEGGQLTARGGWNFETKEVYDAAVDGTLRASAIARWLPEKIGFESATLTGKASGPIDTLQHEGRAKISALAVAGVKPLLVEIDWKGRGSRVDVSEATLRAGDSRLAMAGSFDSTGARVDVLKFTQGTDQRLSLGQPAKLHWSPQIDVEPLQLTGTDAAVSLALSGGENGRMTATVQNFPSSWLTDFVSVPGPAWRLTSLETRSEWGRGPMVFDVRGELAVALTPERFASVSLAAQGDGDGIAIESLRVTEGAAPIVNATGRLPLTLHRGEGRTVQFKKDAPLTLHATTASNPEFWKKLTEASGLEFQEPEMNVELSGTWERPRGELTARAARVSADPQRISFPFPTIENLDAHAIADEAGLTVDRLSASVEKQIVRASGRLPLKPDQWGEFKRTPVDFLRREGSFRLEIPDAEVAAFGRYTQQLLAPTGRLHVDVEARPGGELSGMLSLTGGTTRQLGPLGVLQELEVEIQLAGRSLELKKVTARAGGQPVTVTGKVELPVNAAPRYDLALTGENFPLVRQTGLLMRADLDLKLVTQPDDVTAVTGAVKLRESMFLSDVRALIPRGGGGGPSRRPPFFSVEIVPLNSWRLAVDVRGDQFLRLRSTVFVGVASARFRLGGTLGEPRATGEAVVDSGQVLLPFATFRVEQGTVRLTEGDPYSLRLFLAGTSRRYGYDLRMELTGTATDPVVAFSSSPPLDAKQVLLMVTAGELPRNEITYGSTQRVARLGTYLGQSLINNFGGDATEADRLSISTGERVSRQGRETYEIEYRLNDRFTLVGEYDEFDDYNAGVKWRMFAPKNDPIKSAAASGPVVDKTGQPEKKEVNDAPPR